MNPTIPYLLNQTLSSKFIRLRFLVPPIAIPVNKLGIVVKADKAETTHYGTPVYSDSDGKIYFLEFSEILFAGIVGYTKRHKSLDRLEIIFNKKDDGVLRMTIGSESSLPANTCNELVNRCKLITTKVSQFYKNNLGYQVHDFGGKVDA